MHAKWLGPYWEWVPVEILQSYQQMQNLVKIPRKLREEMEKATEGATSCIPYIEGILRNISSIHSVMPDTIADGLINFEKRRKIYDSYNQLAAFMNHPYEFPSSPKVQQFLCSAKLFSPKDIRDRSQSLPRMREAANASDDGLSSATVQSRSQHQHQQHAAKEGDWRHFAG